MTADKQLHEALARAFDIAKEYGIKAMLTWRAWPRFYGSESDGYELSFFSTNWRVSCDYLPWDEVAAEPIRMEIERAIAASGK